MNTTQLQAMTKMVGMESGASGDCDSQKGDLKLTSSKYMNSGTRIACGVQTVD